MSITAGSSHTNNAGSQCSPLPISPKKTPNPTGKNQILPANNPARRQLRGRWVFTTDLCRLFFKSAPPNFECTKQVIITAYFCCKKSVGVSGYLPMPIFTMLVTKSMTALIPMPNHLKRNLEESSTTLRACLLKSVDWRKLDCCIVLTV